MRAQPMIQPLDFEQSIYVLRDKSGAPIGTGTREALEVLLYILEQAQHSESRFAFSRVPRRDHVSANVRSALVF